MKPRRSTSVFLLARVAALGLVLGAAALPAQAARVVDEGTFVITRPGAASETENFRITRIDNGQLQATGQLTGGARRASSRLVTDSLGTPLDFQLTVFEGASRAPTMEVRAIAQAGRLSSLAKRRGGEESMHEYPLTVGRCVVLDDDLAHLFYFVTLAKRTGPVDVITPRGARLATLTLTARGMEPVTIEGKAVTGTHYTLSNGGTSRELWIDAAGLLLRVENPATQMVATRQELPR